MDNPPKKETWFATGIVCDEEGLNIALEGLLGFKASAPERIGLLPHAPTRSVHGPGELGPFVDEGQLAVFWDPVPVPDPEGWRGLFLPKQWEARAEISVSDWPHGQARTMGGVWVLLGPPNALLAVKSSLLTFEATQGGGL